MRPRTAPRPPAPTDAEILTYDNVPVKVAALYLGWTEKTVMLALREARASFGIAIPGGQMTYKISPGGLVEYKRRGLPCMDYQTMQTIIYNAVNNAMEDYRNGLDRVGAK